MPQDTVRVAAPPADRYAELPLDEIRPSATNPRKKFAEAELEELDASIRVHGVLQPVLVRPRPAATVTSLYNLAIGDGDPDALEAAKKNGQAKPAANGHAGKNGRAAEAAAGKCRVCGCVEADCRGCVERTGEPCSWTSAARDLCTACLPLLESDVGVLFVGTGRLPDEGRVNKLLAAGLRTVGQALGLSDDSPLKKLKKELALEVKGRAREWVKERLAFRPPAAEPPAEPSGQNGSGKPARPKKGKAAAEPHDLGTLIADARLAGVLTTTAGRYGITSIAKLRAYCEQFDDALTGVQELAAPKPSPFTLAEALAITEALFPGYGEADDGRCRKCGCTEDSPCAGGCSWVEPDLCSACAGGE